MASVEFLYNQFPAPIECGRFHMPTLRLDHKDCFMAWYWLRTIKTIYFRTDASLLICVL